MRCATSFVDCPGSASVREVCQNQLETYYCGVSHYPAAPLCQGYNQGPDAASYIRSLDYICRNGLMIANPEAPAAGGSGDSGAAGMAPPIAAAGGGGQAGSALTPPAASSGGMTPGASSSSAAGSGGPTARRKSGGCSATPVRHDSQPGPGTWFAALGLLALTIARRRR